MKRLRAVLSLVINVLLVIFTIHSVLEGFRMVSLRYFTIESNIYCALSSLCVAPFALYSVCTGKDRMPKFVSIFKFSGTCAVTITMLTVFLFLGPNGNWRELLSGGQLYMHVINPCLALVSLLLLDGGRKIPKSAIAFGVLPVMVYGVVYAVCVLLCVIWPDFYGFNRGGYWYVSAIVMALGETAVSVGLRLARNAICGDSE